MCGYQAYQRLPALTPREAERAGQFLELLVVAALEQRGVGGQHGLREKDVANEVVGRGARVPRVWRPVGELRGDERMQRLDQLSQLAVVGAPRVDAQPRLAVDERAEAAHVRRVRPRVDE